MVIYSEIATTDPGIIIVVIADVIFPSLFLFLVDLFHS
jgi:hypothetical protein